MRQMNKKMAPAVTDFAAARAKARHPTPCSASPAVVEIGDAEKALAASDHGVDETYSDAVPEPQRDRAACRDRRMG